MLVAVMVLGVALYVLACVTGDTIVEEVNRFRR